MQRKRSVLILDNFTVLHFNFPQQTMGHTRLFQLLMRSLVFAYPQVETFITATDPRKLMAPVAEAEMSVNQQEIASSPGKIQFSAPRSAQSCGVTFTFVPSSFWSS